MPEHTQQFDTELKRINDLLGKRVSYKRMFLLGIVHGIGSAIGATIIAGIALALLFRFINQFGYFNFLEQTLSPASLDKSMENSEY